MKWYAPKGIDRRARHFEIRVGRRADKLCENDPTLTRQKARAIAIGQMSNQSGSRSDEKRKRKQAEVARVRGMVAEIKRARREGAR